MCMNSLRAVCSVLNSSQISRVGVGINGFRINRSARGLNIKCDPTDCIRRYVESYILLTFLLFTFYFRLINIHSKEKTKPLGWFGEWLLLYNRLSLIYWVPLLRYPRLWHFQTAFGHNALFFKLVFNVPCHPTHPSQSIGILLSHSTPELFYSQFLHPVVNGWFTSPFMSSLCALRIPGTL